MWFQWLPWRFMVRQAARAKGFIDPIGLFSKLQRFSQPSEIAVPTELLRLGWVLQARGMMNAQAIQHNLDWIWPFWVKRQFDPRDPAFIPRAFSMTHINLTHRNWTALGVPDSSDYPIVDPRGLVTPFYDGWSLEAWIITSDHKNLVLSELDTVTQELLLDSRLGVRTHGSYEGLELHLLATVEALEKNDSTFLRLQISGRANRKAWLAVSLRPYNPEGVSFVHKIEVLKQRNAWQVDGKRKIYFSESWDRHFTSHYREGDVYRKLPESAESVQDLTCPVGLGTAAALFELNPGAPREIVIDVPLQHEKGPEEPLFFLDFSGPTSKRWMRSLENAATLKVPDEKFQFLYDAALRSIVLHSPREIYPGPYTYKHFWFRDAVMICHAMLCAGFASRVEKAINLFWQKQNLTGYFHSQEGEWDSNGQVLWLLQRYCLMTGTAPKPEWESGVLSAAHWIQKKRCDKKPNSPHAGLFPVGFSAEHLGPNDYYYWDNFWGAQGFESASWLLEKFGRSEEAKKMRAEARDFSDCIERSLKTVTERLGHDTMPASPYRRMDTGAVGSIVAGYPLRLWPADDPRLLASVNFLRKNCFVNGAFFHDIAHSGINPYLTLHIAQVLLRAGASGHYSMMETLSKLASQTGQWPEAIHSQTLGGCMGDGQHIWAAAEWVMMIRNMFVREETNKLILGSGIPEQWLKEQGTMKWGPAPTEFGPVSVEIKNEKRFVEVHWNASWYGGQIPQVEIRLAGFQPYEAQIGEKSVVFRKQNHFAFPR